MSFYGSVYYQLIDTFYKAVLRNKLKNLSKKDDDFVLKGVNLKVKRGEIFSILGENITISENCYVELLNNQNLIIRHNNNTKQKAP